MAAPFISRANIANNVVLADHFAKVIFIAIACLLLVHPASAQQLSIQRYTVRDGLAHSRVRSIHQDKNDYLWFGTDEGLSRFDGYRFINYGARDGLAHSLINDITEDSQGTLWVATNGGGVSRFVNESGRHSSIPASRIKFLNFLVGDSAPSNRVNRLVFGPTGDLWCATDDGIYRADANSLIANAPRFERGFAGVPLEAIAKAALSDSQGRLWFGVRGEVIEILNGQLINYDERDGLKHDVIVSIAEDGKGRLLAAGGNGVFEFVTASDGNSRGRWNKIPLTVGAGNAISRIVFDPAGALWVGTSPGGLIKFQDSKQTLYTTAQGLSDNIINSLLEDRAGNLWIGTFSSGICKLPGETMVSFTRSEGLPEPGVLKIIEDQSGRIYASTTGSGLVRIVEEHVSPILASQTPEFANLNYRITQDQRGSWWIGTDRGLFRFDEPELRLHRGKRLTLADGIPAVGINSTYVDPAGRVWVSARDDSLYCFDVRSNNVERVPLKTESPFREVYEMIGDRSGAIWLGAQTQLGRLKNGSVTMIERSEGLPETDPRVFFVDSRGWLWIGLRYKGVSMTRDPAAERPIFVNFSTDSGLASNSVWAITEDDAGRIYFGTGRGLDRLDLSTGRVGHFTTADGLAGDLINHCLKDSRGNIWIATSMGVSRFNTRREHPANGPPPVYLSRIQIAGEDQPLAESGATRFSGLELAASRNNLLIEYVGLDFHSERELKYQYRLEGVDSDWGDPTDQRSVNFARLAPGSYRFLVRAINGEGVASAEPAAIEFRILPPFWQRWWFLALASAVVGLIIYLIYRYRVRQLIALERVRVRIASDLHDDIGSNLSLIAGLSEVLGQQARRSEPQMTEKLSLIASVSRKSVDAMSDIVWAVNPNKDHLGDLTQRMRRFASDTFTASGMDFHFDAPDAGHDTKIEAEVRREVFLIFKEGVNNITRHSGCTLAEIALTLTPESIALKMSDNGRGFDTARADGGQGIASMRRRAENLGGELAVISRPGSGAILTLKAGLKRRSL